MPEQVEELGEDPCQLVCICFDHSFRDAVGLVALLGFTAFRCFITSCSWMER